VIVVFAHCFVLMMCLCGARGLMGEDRVTSLWFFWLTGAVVYGMFGHIIFFGIEEQKIRRGF
jgi:hypothetical protein